MNIRDRIDTESRGPLDEMLAETPGGFNAIKDIRERRQKLEEQQQKWAKDQPPNENVVTEDREIPGPEEAPPVGVRVYRPKAASGVLPGIFFIHGGGMIMGAVEGENLKATELCEAIQAVVVSVEYRLAPEHPHPAPVRDCYAALKWMAQNADELAFDVDRLAVVGGSAGGGLTIATTMMARDKGFPRICFQMPLYPMIDDRNETPSSYEIMDVGVWDREGNVEAWQWYLGGKSADNYAAPARAENLAGLPPTFIDVGELDLFRDEDIQFAARLIQAGVPTELHVYPGAYHASEVFAPESALSQSILARRTEALLRALKS
ncbi:MAG: alpha/beta hydrolase [Deltaproteobacteria bacterium]|nr:alpha/beta hydrolase [Deltaproteobacteria bacterium]